MILKPNLLLPTQNNIDPNLFFRFEKFLKKSPYISVRAKSWEALQ